ncbi:unnamed protein product [Caenorhabditis angaria]|uniref:Uncharacterized protein n=1 Tax=Caenorhabditis angaria TaxID=860376 RepID=A0A9P1N928_9PELO|nr:unnamed protein product [Caenorhabditis angaria]
MNFIILFRIVLLRMDDALKEAVDQHFEAMYQIFEENRSITSILRQEVLEGSGIMMPSNYDEEDNDNTEEEPKHATEIQRQKKEREIELAEEIAEKATVKSIVVLMHSDGWFEEEDDEDKNDDED